MTMKNTRHALGRHNNVVGWAVLLGAALLIAPSFLVPILWINLRDVHVDSVPVGGDPQVTIDRVIHRDQLMGFTTVLRNSDTKEFICQGQATTPFTYRVAAGQVNPLKMGLAKWMGPTFPVDCAVNLLPGRYEVQTCHIVYVFWRIPFARRCIMSNSFEITPVTEE